MKQKGATNRMNKRHITRDEWTQFYTVSQPSQSNPSLQGRILAHVAFCKECALIYKGARTLKKTPANAFSVLGWNNYEDIDSAYLAVASDSQLNKRENQTGYISVEIDGQEGIFRFVDDSVITKGCANKYALNIEDDGFTLRDDFDAMILTIRDGKLILRLEEDSIHAQGVLRTLEKTKSLEKEGNMYIVALPQNALCFLEITLSE